MESGEGFHGYSKPAAQIESSTGTKTPEVLADDKECLVREQDRFMPIANVIRLMRKIIPSHAKISDDAKETIQECVSEFISFVTGEANARCQHEQRKTITAEDVLWAMDTLGFDEYIEPLTIYLNRFRDIDSDGSIKGEPLMKRSVVESGSLGFAAFAPAFHNGFFGSAAAMGGFMMNDAHNAGPSGAAVAGVETCAKYKE